MCNYALTGLAVEGWGAAPTFLVFCGSSVVLSLIPLFWAPTRKFD
jgi:hypothetical protein